MKVPVSGTFELTKRCNLNCRMCYIHDQRAGEELDARSWIMLGEEACEKGMLYLLLTGGEPWIRPDFSYIYEELIKLGLRISMNTNGILLTDEILTTLKQYPPEQINLTLYGASKDTYQKLCGNGAGYEKVWDNLRRLKEAQMKVALNTTFTRLNIHDMSEIIKIAREEELPIRMASYIFPPAADATSDLILKPEEMGRAIAAFEQETLSAEALKRKRDYIRKLPEKKTFLTEETSPVGSRCMAGCGAFWISHEGLMYPCGMLRDGQPVLEAGFERCWDVIKEKAGQMSYPKECLVCTRKKICPFCQAVYENLGNDMTKVREYICAQTDAYMKRH